MDAKIRHFFQGWWIIFPPAFLFHLPRVLCNNGKVVLIFDPRLLYCGNNACSMWDSDNDGD